MTLTWSTPGSNGGLPIAGYTVTASPGGATCTTGNLSCTVGGLTAGVNYGFTVTATNSGAYTSGPSNTLFATPTAAPTAPGAPNLVSAVRADSQVALTWQAPGSNGGSPITGYTATASPGGATCTTTGALFCTVGGLTNGVNYSFTVTATNAVGTGAPSNAMSATPATAPSAPTLLTATAGASQVTLTWSAPGSTGGLPISGYTATASPGGASCTTSALSCTVGGLTPGVTYSFTVTATNTGPYTSGPSNTLFATPTAAASVPGAPNLVSAARADSQVTLTWQAPGLQRRLADHRLHRHRQPRRPHLHHHRRPLLPDHRAHQRRQLLLHRHRHERRRHRRPLELALRNAGGRAQRAWPA